MLPECPLTGFHHPDPNDPQEVAVMEMFRQKQRYPRTMFYVIANDSAFDLDEVVEMAKAAQQKFPELQLNIDVGTADNIDADALLLVYPDNNMYLLAHNPQLRH